MFRASVLHGSEVGSMDIEFILVIESYTLEPI